MEAPEKTPAPSSPAPALIRLGALALGQALALWLITKLLPNIPCNTYIDGASCLPVAPFDQLLVRSLSALIFLPFAYLTLTQLWRWRPQVRPFLGWLVRIAATLVFAVMLWQWGSTVVALVGRLIHG